MNRNLMRRRSVESQFDGDIDVPNLPRKLGLHAECECGHVQLVHEHKGPRGRTLYDGPCGIIDCDCDSYKRKLDQEREDSLETQETLP